MLHSYVATAVTFGKTVSISVRQRRTEMGKALITLFCIGLAFEVAAFFMSQTEHLPWVLHFVVPQYIKGTDGLQKLKTKEPLLPNQRGFDEVNLIIIQKLEESNPREVIDKISIQKLENIGGTKISIGSTVLGDSSRVRATLSNGQTADISFNDLQNEIDKFRSQRLFVTAAIIFILGVVLQIIGVVIQARGARRKTV